MKLFSPVLLVFVAASALSSGVIAFTPAVGSHRATTVLQGYLDDLQPNETEEDKERTSREATRLAEDQVDRFGVGSWEGYVDFGDEFDGGDGQMGVAGDGNKGLAKEWEGAAAMAKSKTMSAKNAWGKTTGYADTLIDQGMESTRAQQLENWMNQQEVQRERNEHKYMTEGFDQVSKDDDWRKLASFGIERNQDFDLDATFGEVAPGDSITETVELTTRINQAKTHEFSIRNNFMGFSDFRARFTAQTGNEWTVEPTEGSLSGRHDTEFLLRFRPQNPGISEGYLVVETDDDKWTYKLTGSSSM